MIYFAIAPAMRPKMIHERMPMGASIREGRSHRFGVSNGCGRRRGDVPARPGRSAGLARSAAAAADRRLTARAGAE
jgi:hypothetical protein